MMLPCSTPGCDKVASLRCPTCVKLDVPESMSTFCDQECFRSAWKLHKQVHAQPPPKTALRKLDSREKQKLAFANFRYTGALRADYVTPRREVPAHIKKPDYATSGISRSEEIEKRGARIRSLDVAEIAKMRKVCRLAREVLDAGAAALRPGVTTDEVDRIIHEACIERDSYPSPLNYYGFPKSVCTSVNEVICHGIPDCRELVDGDIVNLDVTLFHDGFHGDLNETYLVGDNCSDEAKALLKSAHDSLMAGIGLVRPGALFRDFGGATENVARSNGHSVVRNYCGHGINQLFHTVPNIPHYRKNKAVGICRPGQTFTIEPMLSLGKWKDVTWPDNWTAVTEDGSLSAQFEHTLLVTDSGCDVLTAKLPTSPKFFWEL